MASDVRSVLLLSNPDAGGTDGEVLTEVVATMQNMGVTTRRFVLGADGDDADLVAGLRALAGPEPSGTERVVIAGGDGTIHRVLSTLSVHGALPGPTFGVIPLGTGNDLARTLHIPTEPLAAARVAVAGRPRRADLLRDDLGTIVVNAAHVGLGALAAERAQAAKGMLGPLAYAVGAVLAGTSMTDYPIRVEVDGQEVTGPGEVLLMVGLGIGRTIGGGAPLAPRAVPDDGLADVVLVSATGALARADFARRLRGGTHPERDDVLVVRGREVTVRAGPAPLNVDGELLGECGDRTWTIVPGAWSVAVPEDTGVAHGGLHPRAHR